MDAYAAFYEEKLYPLQDGILSTVARSRSRFYLTGGTAIGRAWLGHRYSDDLDFFLSRDPDYPSEVALFLELVEASAGALGYRVLRDRAVAAAAYTQLNVAREEAVLKVDLVNDSAAHVGRLVERPLFPRVDNLRNILSNKLSALYRYEPKDVADIWAIARRASFSWGELVGEAREKELGLDGPQVADVLRSFPARLFDAIKWRQRPAPETFAAELERISLDILAGGENSVALPDSPAL